MTNCNEYFKKILLAQNELFKVIENFTQLSLDNKISIAEIEKFRNQIKKHLYEYESSITVKFLLECSKTNHESD